MKNTYVVGDIHGCLEALQQAISRSPIQPGDRLITLGDYVDRGNNSAGVIFYLQELSKIYDLIAILGNHDQWFLEYIEDYPKSGAYMWVEQGGKETLASYNGLDVEVLKQHGEFLKSLPTYFIDERGRLFIHGGFMGAKVEDDEKMIHIWDRSLWTDTYKYARRRIINPDFVVTDPRLTLYPEIFVGHNTVLRYDTTEPMNVLNVWNLDTGGAYGGKISIMNATTKEFWQSDFVDNTEHKFGVYK